MNTQDLYPLGWTGWISLQSRGLSRVFSNTTVQKHQFFGTQPSLWSNSHIHTWLLEKPFLNVVMPQYLLRAFISVKKVGNSLRLCSAISLQLPRILCCCWQLREQWALSVFPLTLVVPGSSLYSATLWILGELRLLLSDLVTHLTDAPSLPGNDHRQIEGDSPHQNDTHKIILLFQFFQCSLLWDDIPRAPPERHLNDLPVSHLGGFSPEALK